MLMLQSILFGSDIAMVPMTQTLAPQARSIVIDAVMQLQIIPCKNVQDVEQWAKISGNLDDFNDIDGFYTNKNGVFLAMVQDTKVIGMGAIKRIDAEVCELKRMFFASDARGKGLGSTMLTELLQRAQTLGYKKIRLDVYNPATQTSAVRLYKKFGFYEIKPYSTAPAQLFMEKYLSKNACAPEVVKV